MSGSLISSLGSWLLILAIPAHVFLVTGSLRDTGLTLAAQYLPLLLLGPVAGVFADWWDRRRLMIAASLFRAGAVAAMLLGTSPGRYWVLYVALIAESSGGVLYVPAWQARTPAIVGTGTLLSSANSLNAVTDGAVVHAADPEVSETIKRTRQPYFVLQGNICALLAARDHVSVFLYDGAVGPDPDRIITAGHDNKTARTVAIRQGEAINAPALSAMFRHIIASNRAGGWRKMKRER